MKTLGRILTILAVFSLVMGITYVAVNAGSSSTSLNPAAFGRGFRPDAQFPNGGRHEFGAGGRGGWMFGMIKNFGIIAIIVALVTVPKGIRQKRIRSLSTSAG